MNKEGFFVPCGSRHGTHTAPTGGAGPHGGRQAAQQASQRQTGGWEDWSPLAPHDCPGRRNWRS